MSQKGVINRKAKYRIQGYLNHNEEIVIQAQLDAQIRGWMLQDKNIEQGPPIKKENELCMVDTYQDTFLDLDVYRSQRTKSHLLNTYLIEELAFYMLILDIIFLIGVQLYMNWTYPYMFTRGYYSMLRVMLSMHLFYCLSIYILEKYRGHLAYESMQQV